MNPVFGGSESARQPFRPIRPFTEADRPNDGDSALAAALNNANAAKKVVVNSICCMKFRALMRVSSPGSDCIRSGQPSSSEEELSSNCMLTKISEC